MKQHITVEQLKELNLQQLEKYFKIEYNYDGIEQEKFWVEGRYIYTENLKCAYGNFATTFTIGKMIELLENNEDVLFVSIETPTKNVSNYLVGVFYKFKTNKDDSDFISTELCDALWQAVKEVLNG